MPDAIIPALASRRFSFVTNFLVILTGFCLLTIISWPTVMSFDLWIFKDRSSFLNLDYLAFTKHYRIGVDICYSYGLLPVFLQHLAILPFGRGFKPMIGCSFVVMILNAVFWAALLNHLPPQRRWLLAVVVLSPIVFSVNPNFPYSLALLSILFTLLFLLKDRFSLALAISSVGCFCVPSLPLLLTALLGLCIVLRWWSAPDRGVSQLATLLGPGILTYASLAILLGFVFGFGSVAATALPITGARYYHDAGLNKAIAILAFLHPAGYSTVYCIAYYIFSTVTWFVLCALFLFGLSICTLSSALRNRRLEPSGIVTVVFSVMLFAFMFFAYGPRGQHSIYEGVLCAATMVGISVLPSKKVSGRVFYIFLCLGVLAASSGTYKSLLAWRSTSPGPNTFGLYAGAGIADQWSQVLQLSQSHNTLLIGYATGQHLYYPTIESPDAWFLVPGLLFPQQESAVLEQIKRAEIVVVDNTSPSPVVDKDIESELAKMREIHADGPFRILQHSKSD